MGGFAVNLGVCPITVAEIWGAYYSLFMAWRDGYRQVLLEMDSKAAISLIQQGTDSRHPYAMVVTRVQELLRRDWQVLYCHIYRKANRAADCLADVGHSLLLGACFYLFAPSCLGTILRDDLAGVALPRLTV